mgnify:CR=1 FL=1
MPKKAKAGAGETQGVAGEPTDTKVKKSPQERLDAMAARREKVADSPEKLAKLDKREAKLRERIAKKASATA